MLSVPVANSLQGLGDFDCSAIPNARVLALNVEHHDLDSAIDALAGANSCDDLMVARLKKRKLQIRDEIASILAATRDAPGGAIFQGETDGDTLAPRAREAGEAPETGGGSLGIGLAAILLCLLMLVMGWSGMVDSVNQTVAQIYVLSLLAAANG